MNIYKPSKEYDFLHKRSSFLRLLLMELLQAVLIPQSSLGWTLQPWTKRLIIQKCSKCLERTQSCQLSPIKVAVTNTWVCQKSLAGSKTLSFVCIANLPETETARRDTKPFVSFLSPCFCWDPPDSSHLRRFWETVRLSD